MRKYPDGGSLRISSVGVYNEEEGSAGVEKSSMRFCAAKPGPRTRSSAGKRIVDSQTDKLVQPGQSLTLTIDSRIQFVAEREFKAAVEKQKCRSGTVIAMNPITGEIMALANYPTFNPGRTRPSGDDPSSRWISASRCLSRPGSIFKIMTVSAALETTNLTPDSPSTAWAAFSTCLVA